MKTALLALGIFLSLSTFASAAEKSACPVTERRELDQECLNELRDRTLNDAITKQLQAAMESGFKLTECVATPANQIEWKYVNDDAVGPRLDTKLFVGCNSDMNYDGYFILGIYYLGETNAIFEFRGVEVSSFE